MKTVTEILGGAQILFSLSFDLQDSFEEYLTEEHRAFLAILRVIEDERPRVERSWKHRGRRPYNDEAIMRSFIARCFFRIGCVDDLRKRLVSDPNLRMLCGFIDGVPSASTFSRRMSRFSCMPTLASTLTNVVKKYHQDHLVGHINRDSTAIPVRESPHNTKKNVAPKEKRKRGRPHHDEMRPVQAKTMLELQANRSIRNSLSKLEKECAWGCKKNSQGKVSYWKGYKLHLDVTDTGLPISAIVTGANVHDSQAAIPLEKLTEKKVQHLYSLMDAAYDAETIRGYIRGKERVPLIDTNKRNGSQAVLFTPSEKQRYAVRTTVERANAYLKDWLIPRQIYVRGFNKVSFVLMCGVVCLAAIKVLQYFILPSSQAA